jgi:hypothetical protein
MTENRKFDPAVDGWNFHNWSETVGYCIGCALPAGHSGDCELDWDNTYAKTFLAINPEDSADVAEFTFYDTVYKTIAKNGNCFGMSLLALALFKYGGSMGFCSPASFYPARPSSPDLKAPEDEKLHHAINIMHGRQLGARDVQAIIDLGIQNVNDPLFAFNKVKECLSKGDYPLLYISNDKGQGAHTVIPYDYVDPIGYPKLLYIWDSNHPYNKDPNHYSASSTAKILRIDGSLSWSYDSETTHYSYHPIGWIIAIPMSTVLEKSYQPFTIALIAQGLMSLVVSGSGSGVSQIEDDKGHRFYTTDSDIHTSGNEIETDPDKRLRGAIRWPQFDSNLEDSSQNELYFVRRQGGDVSPLTTTIVGTDYKMTAWLGKNLIAVNSSSNVRARDIIKTQGLVSGEFLVEITAAEKERKITYEHLLSGDKRSEWRRFRFENIVLPEKTTLSLDVERKMNAVAVSSQGKEAQFDLEIQHRSNNEVVSRKVGKVSTVPGKVLRIAPETWKTLKETNVLKEVLEKG